MFSAACVDISERHSATQPGRRRGQLLRPFPEFGDILMHESTDGSHRQYNAVSLKALMERVGFHEVERCEYREGRCPDLDQIETRQWSLFMEGVK